MKSFNWWNLQANGSQHVPYQGFDERLTNYNYVMHRRKIDQVVTRSSLEREIRS